MLFSFPCLKPCTWDWVESKSKKIEVALLPGRQPPGDPGVELGWGWQWRKLRPPEPANTKPSSHLLKLSKWTQDALCSREQQINPRNPKQLSSFPEAMPPIQNLVFSDAKPRCACFGKCATPALDRLSWSAALRLPSFSLSNTFDTSLSRCKCYNLKSLHLLFSIWIIRGLLP